MTLAKLLPGAAMTEKPLVTDGPHHRAGSQPSIPGKHLSVRGDSAEQLVLGRYHVTL